MKDAAAPNTAQKLVVAAAALLDAGGTSAVTLRAVGHAVGVSHNAPYKHFPDRAALLAAVATADFTTLQATFAENRSSATRSLTNLRRALDAFIAYGNEYPARYQLLFSNPDIAAHGGDPATAAFETFLEFAAIVAECQAAGDLPAMRNLELTGLIFATAHGLIDLEVGGRMKREKRLASPSESMKLLLSLLQRSAASRS